MGAPVRESDDGKPSKSEPPKNAPAKGTPKDVGAATSSRAMEVPDAPWKRNRRREVFEGDVALVELRSRLALGPERIKEPAVPLSTATTFSRLLWLMSGVAMTAAVAGVAGYIWDFKLSTKMPELTLASGEANVLPAPPPVGSLTASNRDSATPAAARTASVGSAPV